MRVSRTWMWIIRSSSSASAAQPASISSVQRCGPDGAGADRDPLVGTVEALDGAARERRPLVPRRRLLALEPVDEPARDEALVEHDGLVVGAVAHPERDQRPQPEVAVRAHDRLERLVVSPSS